MFIASGRHILRSLSQKLHGRRARSGRKRAVHECSFPCICFERSEWQVRVQYCAGVLVVATTRGGAQGKKYCRM